MMPRKVKALRIRSVEGADRCEDLDLGIPYVGSPTRHRGLRHFYFQSLHHDLPVVTMSGSLMRGRHSMAILKMMGVDETITETVDDYVSTAIRLARDVPWRMAVKNRLSENKHRLYRDSTCISALEDFSNRAARAVTEK